MMKTIEIIVAPDGKTTVQTKGFIGSTCREASKFIEMALGKGSGEQLTGKFHQAESVRQENRQRT